MAGDTISRTAHFVLHRLSLPEQQPSEPLPAGPGSFRPQALFAVRDVWIGALVPKRWARRAVTRNLIKRQVYSVSCALEPRLNTAAYVVRLRSAFDRKTFISASSTLLKSAVREELQVLLSRALPKTLAPQEPT